MTELAPPSGSQEAPPCWPGANEDPPGLLFRNYMVPFTFKS